MTYHDSGQPIPEAWRLPSADQEGLTLRQFFAQLLAMALRPAVTGAYVVLFVDDEVYGYQHGLVEDADFEAVARLARAHKHLTED